MADDNEEDSWRNFLVNNRLIPLHPSRKTPNEEQSTPYRLNLKYIENIPVPNFLNNRFALEDDLIETSEFQVRVTLYDAANKHFFGGTWLGAYLPWKKMENGKAKLVCNEALYFHSSLQDVTCIAAVEIIALDEVKRFSCSCTWGILRIFDPGQELEDSSFTKNITTKRLSFMKGGLEALYFINEPLEEFAGLRTIPGCQLVYQYTRHSALDSVSHLFPENALIGGDDIVPGVKEGPPDASGIIDILYKPRLEKTFTSFIDKVRINLSPCVEDFEKQLIDDLNADRLIKNNVANDGITMRIIERKLMVGIHNGWKFVNTPHVVVLEPEYANQVKMSSKASSTSSLKGNITSLLLRGRLNLTELIPSPLVAIVFQLTYVISEEFSKPVVIDSVSDPGVKKKRTWRTTGNSPTGSLVRSKSFNVCVRQGAWEAFRDDVIDERTITLDLLGDMSFHPGNVLTWRNLKRSNDQNFEDTVRFRFSPKRKTSQKRSPSQLSSSHRSSMVSGETYNTAPSDNYLSVSYAKPADHIVRRETPMSFASDLPPYRQSMPSPERASVQDHVSDISPVRTAPQHGPVMMSGAMVTRASPTLTRAGHARLTSAQFPKVLDRHGNPPLSVDPTVVRKYDFHVEQTDIRHCNEIILQFLALSGCYHRTVFFTLQFFRSPEITTERLALRDIEEQAKTTSSLPCLLQKFNKDGTLDNKPGLQLKYSFDPNDMQPGEMKQLWQYLNGQLLHIDMWDGDSLLLIGSTSVQLKHLLRQGQEAVQVVHELDIMSTEYMDDLPATSIHNVQNSFVKPMGSIMNFEGKLHFRMANIGHPSDTVTTKPCVVPRKQRNIIRADEGNETYKFCKTSKAKLMTQCDQELASVLFARDKKNESGNNEPTKEADVVRKRKLERMQAIRNAQKGNTSTTPQLIKEEKIQRARDLKTVQMYRQQYKKEGIMELLSRNITTTHTIYTGFGHTEFFEFVLKNPFSTEVTVLVQTEYEELSVVSDMKEWKHFKKITQTLSNIEDDLFNMASDSGYPEVFMRSRESVNIPFKYQHFRTANEQDTSSNQLTVNDVTRKAAVKNDGQAPRTFKVIFETTQQQRISILSLTVEPQAVTVDETFRFYHPEQSFFKKTIRLPPWHALADEPQKTGATPLQIHVQCSDCNIICQTTQTNVGEPQDIMLKVPCGPSPSVRRFYIFLYTDPFLSAPKQTWQIYVHAMHRVDMSGVEGQTTRLSCIIRGTPTSRLVQCYSSHPEQLKVEPVDPFMLMANSVQEINFNFTPSSPGTKQIYVNVVDTEFHQLVRSWLVCATTRPPVISKTFDVNVEIGGGKGSHKRIHFQNPYPVGKTFYLKSNREDVLQFGNTTLTLGPAQSQSISLRFQPWQTRTEIHVLLFIYDDQGKNEETFLVKVNYT